MALADFVLCLKGIVEQLANGHPNVLSTRGTLRFNYVLPGFFVGITLESVDTKYA